MQWGSTALLHTSRADQARALLDATLAQDADVNRANYVGQPEYILLNGANYVGHAMHMRMMGDLTLAKITYMQLGVTPLHHLSRLGDPSLVAGLLGRGADVHARDKVCTEIDAICDVRVASRGLAS